jgi:hypothetical protein
MVVSRVELTEQREKIFKFNRIFGPDALQTEIYQGI